MAQGRPGVEGGERADDRHPQEAAGERSLPALPRRRRRGRPQDRRRPALGGHAGAGRRHRMAFLPLCATSPSAWAAPTTRSTRARCSISSRTRRPCRRTCARSRRPCSPRCRASGRSSTPGCRSAMKEASRLQQLGLQARDRHRLQGRRACARRASRCRRSLALAFWLARVLVLDNVRSVIGVHRARLLVTGAAPISPDLVRWYMALGAGDARGLGPDRVRRRRHLEPDRPQSSRARSAPPMPHTEVKRLARGRAAGARPHRVHGLPQPAGEDRRDAEGRLAAHRRRRQGGRGRLLLHHRPHEGHHHHRGRQEHHALGNREPAQVLALHHRRGGDRRQARPTWSRWS